MMMWDPPKPPIAQDSPVVRHCRNWNPKISPAQIETRSAKGQSRRSDERAREKMLQFPAFMTQYPSSTTNMIPTAVLLPSQWPCPHSDDLLLAMEESEFEAKCSEIRKTNNDLVVIGKTTVDNDKEDFDNEADDDDADNAEESEGDEFEQETG